MRRNKKYWKNQQPKNFQTWCKLKPHSSKMPIKPKHEEIPHKHVVIKLLKPYKKGKKKSAREKRTHSIHRNKG